MSRPSHTFLALASSVALLVGCSSTSDNNEAAVETSSSAASTPTTTAKWYVSNTGQPYVVATGKFGDVVSSTVSDKNELEQCKGTNPRQFRTSPVTPEVVQDRFILFSNGDGPGEISNNGAPIRYSASPFGAALAAYNVLSLFAGWGEYFHVAADEVMDVGAPVPEVLPDNPNAGRVPNLPLAFKVTNCTERTAVVDLLLDPSKDDGTLGIAQFTMVYENGMWIWRFDPFGELSSFPVDRDSLNWGEWTQWHFG